MRKNHEKDAGKRTYRNRKCDALFCVFLLQTGQCVKVFHGHHQGVNCIEVCKALLLLQFLTVFFLLAGGINFNINLRKMCFSRRQFIPLKLSRSHDFVINDLLVASVQASETSLEGDQSQCAQEKSSIRTFITSLSSYVRCGWSVQWVVFYSLKFKGVFNLLPKCFGIFRQVFLTLSNKQKFKTFFYF